jgi:1-acyl-sn-glycerol-3-phosphate acyltransferase
MLFIRSFAFQIYFYLITFYVVIINLPKVLINRSHAHYVYYQWACLTAWGLKKICFITIAVRGAENISQGAALYACKHQSVMETALMFLFIHRPAIILKKELSYIPLVKYLIEGAGHICVNRQAGAKARQHIVTEAKKRLKNNQQVLIFPEGTRSAVNSAPRYKRGIYGIYHHTQIACTPIALNTGLFWPRHSFLRYPGTVIFEFLPPIEAGLSEDEFMTTLTTRIEGTVARLIQEGVAEQASFKRKKTNNPNNINP